MVRLRPAPQYEPPFDDEPEAATWLTATHVPERNRPRRAEPGEGLHATPSAVVDAEPNADPATEPNPGLAAGEAARSAGDARLAVRRFVSACVEVLNGYRPAAHLRRLALPMEANRVVAQAIAGAHRVAELRSDDPRRQVHRSRRRPAPAAVLRVRHCEPRPGAIEASVILLTGERTWALALRLELHDESWVATTLRLV